MTDLVPPDEIENIVGVSRHGLAHYARAVSSEQTVYILHSKLCRDSGLDLRCCRYSQALDLGIDLVKWADYQDVPVVVGLGPDDRLTPIKGTKVRS